MTDVKKVSITHFNLLKELDNNKDLQKCINVTKNLDYDILYLLPKGNKTTVSFELTNSNADIANGIRRCVIDEIPVKSFDFDEYKDLDSDDPFILCDFIKKQIDLLCIHQEYDYRGLKISLVKENTSDEIIDVRSDDIIIVKGEDAIIKQKDIVNIIEKNIVLCRLRPGKYIKINNIKIVEGNGRTDAGKFNSVSNFTYKILDVDPIVDTRLGQDGVSSMRSNPKHFYLSYTTHRNFNNAALIMVKCCDALNNRLDNILTEMEKITNSTTEYDSKLIKVESSGASMKKIHFKHEYWTIVNLIARYCFILTKGDIPYVSAALIHPEKETGIVNISHPEFATLIKNSIKKIITEFKTIKKSFL